MLFKVDELLFLENLTYLENIPPLLKITNFKNKTIKELVNSIDLSKLDSNIDYAAYITGDDWKNELLAIKANNNLLETKILDTHLDTAFGGGLGLSAIFINEENKEAVIAFRGTAKAEWTDDFLGANQIDSLQQINALEWYKSVYEKYKLKNYYITVIGHSKGGNKAKYVTILNDTINRCVSFDGQGFSDKFMDYYKSEIIKRQDVIENHNIDFDYVNILMNDIGKKTFYFGFGYGKGGFAESHCPNTFFNFSEDGKYKMEVNPNGQRPEMQILKQFINSMIRSAETDKDRSKNNMLVGSLVENAFGIGSEMSTSDFITYLCDMVGNEEYIDNAAYVLAFAIKYAKENKNFLKALKDIMTHFNAIALVDTINMLEDIVNSKKLNFLLGVSNFLITHVNKIVVKKIQNVAKKNYDVDLTKEQITKVLALVSIIKEKIKTLEVNYNGSDIKIELDSVNEDDNLFDNLNIVVLAGGLSVERNISLYTGYNIYKELLNQGHNVILLDSYMGYGDEELNIADPFENPDKYSMNVSEISEDIPDLWAVRKRRIYQSNSYFGPNVLNICLRADLVFIALNGSDGENGKIQSTFDLLGIDYTGNDYLSVSRTSNKILVKELLKKNDIPVLNGYSLNKNEEIKYPSSFNIDYPVIIKTNTNGFIGIKAAIDDNSFIDALNDSFKWDNELIIEEYKMGREFSISTLNLEASKVLEELPLNTNDNEIGMNLSGIKAKRCPAIINDELKNKLIEYSIKATKALGLNAYSKIDFILSDNQIYCINCDSLPKLSPYSHFSTALLESNIDYSSLLKKIIELSLKKNQ